MRNLIFRTGLLFAGAAAVGAIVLGLAILASGDSVGIYRPNAAILLTGGAASIALLAQGSRVRSTRFQRAGTFTALLASVIAWLFFGAVGYPGWPEDFNSALIALAAGGLLCALLGRPRRQSGRGLTSAST